MPTTSLPFPKPPVFVNKQIFTGNKNNICKYKEQILGSTILVTNDQDWNHQENGFLWKCSEQHSFPECIQKDVLMLKCLEWNFQIINTYLILCYLYQTLNLGGTWYYFYILNSPIKRPELETTKRSGLGWMATVCQIGSQCSVG